MHFVFGRSALRITRLRPNWRRQLLFIHLFCIDMFTGFSFVWVLSFSYVWIITSFDVGWTFHSEGSHFSFFSRPMANVSRCFSNERRYWPINVFQDSRLFPPKTTTTFYKRVRRAYGYVLYNIVHERRNKRLKKIRIFGTVTRYNTSNSLVSTSDGCLRSECYGRTRHRIDKWKR